MKSRRHSSIDA